MTWLDGFERVTFAHSLGFPHRWPSIRGVGWHETQGSTVAGALSVYRDTNKYPKGACPNFTCDYKTGERLQHVDTLLASYAVQHGDATHPCKTETNASGIIQIERVGFTGEDISMAELRWYGEQVLAPILAAHPEIPPWVYHGPRMNEDEWAAWPGGQCRHRDVCCQPAGHSDTGDTLDLDVILHYALDLLDSLKPKPETDMILLRVTDDPAYPSGVFLELSGNGLAWVQSGNLPAIYGAGGVRTVDCTKAIIDDVLLTKPGVGPSPSTVGSVVHW